MSTPLSSLRFLATFISDSDRLLTLTEVNKQKRRETKRRLAAFFPNKS